MTNTIHTNLENWTGETAAINIIRRTETNIVFTLHGNLYNAIYSNPERLRVCDRDGFLIAQGFIQDGEALITAHGISRTASTEHDLATGVVTAAARLLANLY